MMISQKVGYSLYGVILACPESFFFTVSYGTTIPPGLKHTGAGLESSGNDDFLRNLGIIPKHMPQIFIDKRCPIC